MTSTRPIRPVTYEDIAAAGGCRVKGPHCEECGQPVRDTDDGYSPCCGEHVASGPGCDGLHAEAGLWAESDKIR